MLQLVLNSMHKYQPRIHLVLRREGAVNAPITDLEQEEFKTFIFPECVFTAVTAYQNQLVSTRCDLAPAMVESGLFGITRLVLISII